MTLTSVSPQPQHYKGFRKIQALDAYTGLRCLWLEGNGLDEIGGLENQAEMRTLYLHENCIHEIKGLDALTNLDTLNLAKNFIGRVEGLGACQNLKTLILAHNHLATADDLRECPKSLVSLDVQSNRLDDPAVLDVIAALPELRVVYLMGNPVVKAIRYYRKTVLAACPGLTYLDDRPVFADERRRVSAWKRAFDDTGDYERANEAERQEIKAIRDEKAALEQRNFRAFDAMVRCAFITAWHVFLELTQRADSSTVLTPPPKPTHMDTKGAARHPHKTCTGARRAKGRACSTPGRGGGCTKRGRRRGAD